MPLLNGYKTEFLLKRLPQTLLGGPKLHFRFRAPFYVYVNQLILFILPFILGGILTAITELAQVRFDIVCYIYGGLMFVFTLSVQLISYAITRNRASVSPGVEAKHNILSEGDEIEFMSCCGRETVEFVSPTKPFLLLIPLHGIMNGLLGGVGLWFLLPSVLNSLYSSSVAATVCIFVFGWLTMCVGMYSLAVVQPPELSQYRALATYVVVPQRPVHMAVCFVLHVVAVSVSDSTGILTVVNQVDHVIFCTLPVLWMSGLLPSAEPLVLWGLEQAHVHLLGGSHMANTIRTVSLAVLSVLTLLIHLARDSPLAVLVTLTGLGYVLSQDICGHFGVVVKLFQRRCRLQKPIRWILLKVAFYCLMLGLACAATALTYIYTSDVEGCRQAVGFAVVATYLADYFLRSLQKVYWFGLLRNPLFPPSMDEKRTFNRRKKLLFAVGLFRRFFVNAACPVLMLVYVVSHLSSEYGSMIPNLWHCITVARALRWIFQSTTASLLDMSIHALLTAFLPKTTSIWWTNVGSGTQLLIISAARDRIQELINKLYTLFFVFYATIADINRRSRFNCEAFVKYVVPFLLLPLYVFVVVLPSTLLSAPLLPVFTLPFFWISSPRPRHFWSTPVCSRKSEVNGDALLYEQAMPALTEMVNSAISVGALDNNPGAQYLLRFQDRLVWTSVLESGYSYTTLQMKGLELQETSCHTLEASRIDEMFRHAFERGSTCRAVNMYVFNTLTPKDSNYIGTTYSDARYVLNGIIDSPNNLREVYDNLSKVLAWVILNHILGAKKMSTPKLSRKEENVDLDTVPVAKVIGHPLVDRENSAEARKTGGVELKASKPLPAVIAARTKPPKAWEPLEPSIPDNVKVGKLKSRDAEDCDLEDLLDDWYPPTATSSTKLKAQVNKISLVTGRPISPTLSEADSVWSNDSPDEVPMKQVRSTAAPDLLPAVSNRLDDFSIEAEDSFSPPSFVPYDIEIPDVHKTNLLADIRLGSIGQLYQPPSRWLSVPLERTTLDSLTTTLNLLTWYKLVIRKIAISLDASDKEMESLADDQAFCRVISYIVALGRWVFYLEMSSDDGASMGSSHIYKSYVGHIYNSAAEKWLSKNEDLKQLFVQSYRYAVKLMIDDAVLGPLEDLEELADSLVDYDRSWYIGHVSEPLWSENLKKRTSNLFSLVQHSVYSNWYSSRSLTSISLPVHVGSLNDELVRAQWANLSLELLYMTNDDEERYSIQAQPNILRNLTVQSADPPLGYPLYTSPVVSIQNL